MYVRWGSLWWGKMPQAKPGACLALQLRLGGDFLRLHRLVTLYCFVKAPVHRWRPSVPERPSALWVSLAARARFWAWPPHVESTPVLEATAINSRRSMQGCASTSPFRRAHAWGSAAEALHVERGRHPSRVFVVFTKPSCLLAQNRSSSPILDNSLIRKVP